MAIYDFRIGAAPDFMMTKGKVIYPHKAELELAFDSGAKSSVMVSNPRLSTLIVGIKEKLVAIGWTNDQIFSWTEAETVTGEAKGKKGSAIVVFKFPEEMGAIQIPTMIKNIMTLFSKVRFLPK